MAKKNSLGYQAQLARRKMQRAVTRLEKLASSKAADLNSRAAARKTAFDLKAQIAKTYVKQNVESVVKSAIARGEQTAEASKIAVGKNGYKNLATQFQLNLGAKKLAEGEVNISSYSREEVKAFYRATQNIWFEKGGTDNAAINQKIMKYFHSTDLAQVVDYVLSQPEVQEFLQNSTMASIDKDNMTQEEREAWERAVGEDYQADETRSATAVSALTPIFDKNENVYLE